MRNISFSNKIISFVLAAVIGFSGASSISAAGSESAGKPSFVSSMFSRLKFDPMLFSLGLYSRFIAKPAMKQITTGGLADYVAEPSQEKIKNKMKSTISHNYGDFKFWTAKFWASPGISSGLFLGTWSVLGGSLLTIPYIGLPLIAFAPRVISSLMPQYKESFEKVDPEGDSMKNGKKPKGIISYVHSKLNWNIVVPALLVGGLLAYNFVKGKELPSFGDVALPVATSVGAGVAQGLVKTLVMEEANYIFDIDRRIARKINSYYSCGKCEGSGSKENPLLTVCSGDPEHVMHKTCALDYVKDHADEQEIGCPVCMLNGEPEAYVMESKTAEYLRNQLQVQWQEYAKNDKTNCSICKRGPEPGAPVSAVRSNKNPEKVLLYAHEACWKAKKPCEKLVKSRSLVGKKRKSKAKKLEKCRGCEKSYKKKDLVNVCSKDSNHKFCRKCLRKAALKKHPKCSCGSAMKKNVIATMINAS